MLFFSRCMLDHWLQTRPVLGTVQSQEKRGPLVHKLRHQPRGSQGTHELPQLLFPGGLEHRSPLRAGTESSLSLSSRAKKGFAQNAAFYITVSWCFQQWWEVQGLGPQGCSSAAGGTRHLPVAQLHSRQARGVVQLQILTGKKKKRKAVQQL